MPDVRHRNESAWLLPNDGSRTNHRLRADMRRFADTDEIDLVIVGCGAGGSVLLLAVTNHLTQNVASVPLLWLVPLTLYLATFIIAFEGKTWYRPTYLWPLILIALVAMAWLLIDSTYHYHLGLQLSVFLPGLFIGCLFCHGELYRTRPAPRHLTAFYLTISAGGALGGLLVAVVAPLVFTGYFELGLGLVAVALLATLRFVDIGRVAYVLGLRPAVVEGLQGVEVRNPLRTTSVPWGSVADADVTGLVAHDDESRERIAKRVRAELAEETEPEPEVVLGAVRLELREEPQPRLSGRRCEGRRDGFRLRTRCWAAAQGAAYDRQYLPAANTTTGSTRGRCTY